jgi:hypothetical protein
MRWERLFEDLAAQLTEAELDGMRSEVADRTRRELAKVRLRDRVRAAQGNHVAIRVSGIGPIHGTISGAGPDWLLLAEPAGTEALVPLAAVVQVSGLGMRASPPDSRVSDRLGLGYVLRGVARDRAEVVVTLVDGAALAGTIDRVGADHLDLAERSAEGVATWVAPFAGLGVVRRLR